MSARGLSVPDRELARRHLQFIGYYRFSGYALPFTLPIPPGSPAGTSRQFRAGASFEDVLRLYNFDRGLRLLVMDAIELIEVAVRASISNKMSLIGGPHWYMDAAHFVDTYDHAALIATIKKETGFDLQPGTVAHKKQETFLRHYYSQYDKPVLPPSWMLTETLSFGTWSIIFARLQSRDAQKAICDAYGVSYVVMTSWLHSLTYVRNLCAHHARLWNRHFTLTPKVMRRYEPQLKDNNSFYAQAVVLQVLTSAIEPGNRWARGLQHLIAANPQTDLKRMGFPIGWEHAEPWSLVP